MYAHTHANTLSVCRAGQTEKRLQIFADDDVFILYLKQHYYRPGYWIYDSGVALRNCGGAPNQTKCQFLHNVGLTKYTGLLLYIVKFETKQ